MDSQTDDLIPFPHSRENINRQRGSFSYVTSQKLKILILLVFDICFRDLFQLGISQEIHNNSQHHHVLVRQNSITTIPTLFPGLPSQGSFLAKAAAEVYITMIIYMILIAPWQ